MRSLSEIQAENDAIVRRAEQRENAKFRRLKQRIANVSWRFESLNAAGIRREIGECIDAWRKAEAKRGGR